MITTSRLGLTVWNLGSDPYDHLELAANWTTIDDELFKRTGDTATGALTIERSAETDPGLHFKVAADSSSRLKLQADGLYLGDGSGSYDIRLYRDGANILKTNDQVASDYSAGPSFVSQSSGSVGFEGHKSTTQSVIQNKLAALDAQPTFSILGSGEIKLGTGGASSTDTRIYRSTAQTVTIESNLVVTNLEATNSITINGVLLNVSGGAIQSNSSLITSSIIRARDGQTGRTQLGDSGDPSRSIIYFGGGADVNLYRDGVDRLRTDDSLTLGQWLQVNSTASDSIETEGGIDVAGVGVFGGNLSTSGTLTVTGTVSGASNASFNGLSVLTDHLRGTNIRARKTLVVEQQNNNTLWYLTANSPTKPYKMVLYSSDFSSTGFGANQTSIMEFDSHQSPGGAAVSIVGKFAVFGDLTASGTLTPGQIVMSSGNITVSTGTISATAMTASTFNGNFQGGTVTGSAINGSSVTAQTIRATGNLFSDFTVVAGSSMHATSFVVTSDERLKTKPRKFSALEKIQAMESLGQWRFSKTAVAKSPFETDTSEPHYGPTAQEFNKQFKSEPVKIMDDYEGINIADMAGIALMGIRELAERMDAIEATLSQEK
jgi:hypothetical protein